MDSIGLRPTKLPLIPDNPDLSTQSDFRAIYRHVNKSQRSFDQFGQLLLERDFEAIETLFESIKHELDTVGYVRSDQFAFVRESFLHIDPPVHANNLKQLKDAGKKLVEITHYVRLEKCRELFRQCNEALLNKDWRQLKDTVIELLEITHGDLLKKHQGLCMDNNVNVSTLYPVRAGSVESPGDITVSGHDIGTAIQRYALQA